jgi:hypothetical protein
MFGLVVAVCLGLVWLFSRRGVWGVLAAVLAMIIVLPLLAGLVFFWAWSDAPMRPATVVLESHGQPARVTVHTFEERPPVVPSPVVPPAPAAPEIAPPAAKPAQPGGLLRMLSGALLRALDDEDGTQPGGVSTPDGSHGETAADAAPKPAWVGKPPGLKDGAYQVPIEGEPYTTRDECDKKLPEQLSRTVDAYAVHLLGPRVSGRIQLPPDYIQGSLVRDTWEEHRFSPSLNRRMVQLHVLVAFDAKATEKIRNEWKQVVVKERVYRLAAGAIVLLLSLTIAWAYLRLDLSTAGRYRWRLRLAAAAALAAVVCLGLTLN